MILLQHPGLVGLGEHFGGVLGVELLEEALAAPFDGLLGQEDTGI